MLIRRVNIRRWDILFYFSFDASDRERIMDALVWAEAPNSILSKVSEIVSAGRPNEGFCYSNKAMRRSVIGIGFTDTGPEFLDSVVHEITHAAQDIATTDGISLYGEEFSYIAGDISHEVSYVVCEMSCPHCRCE